MTPRFVSFLPFVLKWECDWPARKDGDYTEDPDDPGGATRFGIDQRGHPDVDIKHLTYDVAMAIYWQEWQADGCEPLADKLAQVHFDSAVNCGLSRARSFLEAAAGDWQKQIDARESYYRRLASARPGLGKFLKGWLNRTQDLRATLS